MTTKLYRKLQPTSLNRVIPNYSSATSEENRTTSAANTRTTSAGNTRTSTYSFAVVSLSRKITAVSLTRIIK